MIYSIIRFWSEGWIQELYIDPTYHFSFISFVQPLPGSGMYYLYGLLLLSAIGITCGLFYKLSSITFFLSFLFIELIDKTYYLNHYYLVTLISFWFIFVPASRKYALDNIIFKRSANPFCHWWHINIFRIQLSIVYFFAGWAKINGDWLWRAQPLATWLPGLYKLPILGKWLHLKSLAVLFSWVGCIYDLFIWLFLWSRKYVGYAYIMVVVFHLLTGFLFPRIGMFPYIMITSTLIFFPSDWHDRILSYLPFYEKSNESHDHWTGRKNRWISRLLSVYIILQILIPFRYLAHGGNIFWHEKGYRWSWRVMLMEKNGWTQIILKDPRKNTQYEVDQTAYLTAFQRQQMRSQPDMIWQFGQYVGQEFENTNGYAPEIYVSSQLSLNGRRSRPFTNEDINIYGKSYRELNHWITKWND